MSNENYIPVRTMWHDKDGYTAEYNFLSVGFSVDDGETQGVLYHYDENEHLVAETHLDADALTLIRVQLGIHILGANEMNAVAQQNQAEQPETD